MKISTMLLVLAGPFAGLGFDSDVFAQIIPDLSLGSRVSANGVIDGGTTRGANLFHSFERFSIPTGGQAHFNNAVEVRNIFARVSGRSASSIDGLLSANGAADLFLLNPNGVMFGPNAQLNLGGSLLVTSANRIDFADGTQLPATLTAQPLLTSSVPVGLGFVHPGPIRVSGTGHLQRAFAVGTAFTGAIVLSGQGQSQTGLRLAPQHTLALLGGSIDLDGGVVTAPSGRIEIGSVRDGTVALTAVPGGYDVDYSGVNAFGPIALSQQAALDATGDRFSSIQLRGNTIQMTDASLLTISNLGTNRVGNMSLNAAHSIELVGVTPFNQQQRLLMTERIKRSIVSDTTLGPGANIFLNAAHIRLDESAYISALTFGSGRSGAVTVQADRLVIRDIARTETSGLASGIATSTYGPGAGGAIQIKSDRLRVLNSANIATNTYGQGPAGHILIDAPHLSIIGGFPILVFDGTPQLTQLSATLSFNPSFIGSRSTATGSTGNIVIQTDYLSVLDGATLATLAGSFGRAGDLHITANHAVEVSGTARLNRSMVPGFLTPLALSFFDLLGLSPDTIAIDVPSPSAVGSGAGVSNVFGSTILNTPVNPVSQAGSTLIRADRLTVDDAVVTVQNTGRGNAGTLNIQAETVQLTNNGTISAETFSGNGGNIIVGNVQWLSLDNATISASAGNAGDGGNIEMATTLSVLTDRSRVRANAEQGFGGQVQIDATGVFASDDSTISATSELGPQFNGTVELLTPDIDLTSGALPDISPLTAPPIASVCAGQGSSDQSTFVVSGTGGLPDTPDRIRSSQQGWMDLPVSPDLNASDSAAATPIVEAQGWVQNPDGTIQLVVETASSSSNVDRTSPCPTLVQ